MKDAVRRSTSLLIAAVLLALTLSLLRWVVLADDLTAQTRLGALAFAAALSLLVGMGSLGWLLSWRRGEVPRFGMELPAWALILLAYGLPLALLLLPEWIIFLSRPATGGWKSLLGAAGLSAGQPWLYLWQAVVLAGYRLTRSTDVSSRPAPPQAWLIAFSLLIGLGLWLVGMYVFALMTAQPVVLISGALTPPALPPVLAIPFGLVAIFLAPWAEESFWRGELLQRRITSPGVIGSALMTSALFAALQFRPLLFLPAFLLGLGLALLAHHTQRLYPAVLAHMIFNILMLLLGWNRVL